MSTRLILFYMVKHSILVLGIMLFTNCAVHSQSRKLPVALLPLLEKTLPPLERIEVLIQLADYYVESEWNYSNKIKVDSALSYLKQAKKLSDSVQSKVHFTAILRSLGNYYFRCDKPDSASYYYTQLIVFYKKSGEKENEAINWQLFAFRTPFLENLIDSIIYRYQQSLVIYKELKVAAMQAQLSGVIGEMYLAQGKLSEAEYMLQEALNLQVNKSLESNRSTYWQLSRLQRTKGNYDKAIDYGLKAIEGIQSTKDPNTAAVYTDGVGRLYADIGKPDIALRFFYNALDILDKNNDPDWHANNERYEIINQMVPVFLQSEETEKALSLLKQTEIRYPPQNDYQRLLFSISMGKSNDWLRKFKEAEKYYSQALDIAERTGQLAKSSDILFLTAELYVSWKHFDKANEFIVRLLKQPVGLPTTINQSKIDLLQFKADSASGNYLSAIRHYQNYKELNDSIFTVEKSRELDKLQIQYQTVKSEQEIQRLQNKTKLIIAGIILLSIILLLSLWAYRVKQRTNNRLKISQRQTSEANLTLQHIIQEKEWLVKEIHHRVKNNLHIIISLLDSQSAYLQDSDEKNAIKDSQRRIHAMSLLHQKLYMSSDMNSVDMIFYIHELVTYLKESFQTEEKIQFKLDIEPITLDVSTAVTIALILNESITNAMKYAFPENTSGIISIILKKDDPSLYKLSIIDNGVGLPDKFDFHAHASLGLNLIQGLTQDIDGNFDIVNEGGTRISISFPSNLESVSMEHQSINQTKNENESIHS